MFQHVIILDVPCLTGAMATDPQVMPNVAALAKGGEVHRLVPPFPCVTCPVQATLTTGAPPSEHGIIGNGFYDRASDRVAFWTMPDDFLCRPRIWDTLRADHGLTSMALFLQNTRGCTADVMLTPAPKHRPDGAMEMWCESRPEGLYGELVERQGHFDLKDYWGPMASIKSSRWIAQAAIYAFRKFRPNLSFIYIPHLDYSGQRYGPNSKEFRDDHRLVDELIGEIVAEIRSGSEQSAVLILSEYAMSEVAGAVFPNRTLRESGLLAISVEDGKESINLPNSRAFAVVDHQFAHVVARPDALAEAEAVLRDLPGIGRVLGQDEMVELGVAHERSGDFMILTEADKWLAYYWWSDPDAAPDFARTVDIHRKPGYDPVELFFDPATHSIPLDTDRVKGSHGLPMSAGDGACLILDNPAPSPHLPPSVLCSDIPSIAISFVSRTIK